MPAIERPTPDRLIEILRANDEAGDILCGHAADEIERLRLTPGEIGAIEAAIAYMAPVANYNSTPRDTLLGLLKRMTL